LAYRRLACLAALVVVCTSAQAYSTRNARGASVYFSDGEHEISRQGADTLRNLVDETDRLDPEVTIIVGYDLPTESNAARLGEQRAEAAR
jgi:hypothetical protein